MCYSNNSFITVLLLCGTSLVSRLPSLFSVCCCASRLSWEAWNNVNISNWTSRRCVLHVHIPTHPPRVGVYMLTEPHGLDYITHCEKPGFHSHPKEPPLYEVCTYHLEPRGIRVKLVRCLKHHTVENVLLLLHNNVLLLGHVSKIASILLSKLNNCPNTDTLLCYCNYPFLTVHTAAGVLTHAGRTRPAEYIHT